MLTVALAVGAPSSTVMGSDSSPMPRPGSGAGSDAAFSYLSQQHSNECGLTPSGVMAMKPSEQLQGSCCSAMQLASYRRQVAGISELTATSMILRDPYDVPVALAQRLLGFERSIAMDVTQQSTYDAAMAMTPDKGPCCCHCWRWEMTVGLAKYLIVRQQWGAAQVATVVALTNGCGGSWEPATTSAADV